MSGTRCGPFVVNQVFVRHVCALLAPSLFSRICNALRWPRQVSQLECFMCWEVHQPSVLQPPDSCKGVVPRSTCRAAIARASLYCTYARVSCCIEHVFVLCFITRWQVVCGVSVLFKVSLLC